jgi:uncharacterized protein (TIGR02646 family)
LLPIEYSAVDAAIVNEYEARDRAAQAGDYWSTDEVKPVKRSIKTHYIAEQGRHCCYCNRDLGTDHHGVWDAEHIIPKSSHPQWLFKPRNLAAACKDCNLAKSDKPVLKNNGRVTFPTDASDYLIVHPHLDDYHQHIRWIGLVPRPNGSDKGKNTIYMCDLLRFAAAEAGLMTDPGDKRYDQLVGDLMDRPGPNDAAMILGALAAALKVPPSEGAGGPERPQAP